jgi:hypothetical protein
MKGVSTRSIYEDGDMYSLVNLRRKGGALHPVCPHVVEQMFCDEYDFYFIHKSEGREVWIGVQNDMQGNTSSVFWDINAADCGDVKLLKADTGGVINSVEQSGKMLLFVTDRAVYYALYVDNTYKWYGELPELTPLEWGCYEEIEIETDNGSSGKKRGISYADYFGAPISRKLSVEEFTENTEALISGSRGWLTYDYNQGSSGSYDKDSGEFGGVFFDAFYVRYAYRMFDNSLVNLSPPILVMPKSDILDFLRVKIQ